MASPEGGSRVPEFQTTGATPQAERGRQRFGLRETVIGGGIVSIISIMAGGLTAVGAHFYIDRYLGVSDYLHNPHASIFIAACVVGSAAGMKLGLDLAERVLDRGGS